MAGVFLSYQVSTLLDAKDTLRALMLYRTSPLHVLTFLITPGFCFLGSGIAWTTNHLYNAVLTSITFLYQLPYLDSLA